MHICYLMERCFVFHREKQKAKIQNTDGGYGMRVFILDVNYAFKPTITLHCITKNMYAEHITGSLKTIKG